MTTGIPKEKNTCACSYTFILTWAPKNAYKNAYKNSSMDQHPTDPKYTDTGVHTYIHIITDTHNHTRTHTRTHVSTLFRTHAHTTQAHIKNIMTFCNPKVHNVTRSYENKPSENSSVQPSLQAMYLRKLSCAISEKWRAFSHTILLTGHCSISTCSLSKSCSRVQASQPGRSFLQVINTTLS